MSSDNGKQLDLLAMFHFIFGGILCFFSFLPLIHVGIGLAIASGKFDGGGPPPVIGWFFVVGGIIGVVVGLSISICIIVAGKKMKSRKSRVFCMVIAGLECLSVPFGTILGVCTLIALSKDSVKSVFDQSSGVDYQPETVPDLRC